MTNKKKISLENAIRDFGDIPYSRVLEERALFPYSDLNKLTGGIVRGTITAIVADAGAGKTTMVSDIINKLISDGDKVFAMFGEGTIKDQQDKMYRQMTPYAKDSFSYVPYRKNGRSTNIGSYFVDEESESKVREKTRGKFYIYDIRYGMTITDIIEAIDYAIEHYGVRYFVLDNASQIETVSNAETKELKDAFEILRQEAIEKEIGIIVLAHFRKQPDVAKFRRDMTEIIGTSALSQKGVSVISLIRMDYIDRTTAYYRAFEKMMKENGWDLTQRTARGDYAISSVAEVLKSRNGQLGFCCLGFNTVTQTYYQISRENEEKKQTVHTAPTKTATNGLFDALTEVDDGDLPF